MRCNFGDAGESRRARRLLGPRRFRARRAGKAGFFVVTLVRLVAKRGFFFGLGTGAVAGASTTSATVSWFGLAGLVALRYVLRYGATILGKKGGWRLFPEIQMTASKSACLCRRLRLCVRFRSRVCCGETGEATQGARLGLAVFPADALRKHRHQRHQGRATRATRGLPSSLGRVPRVFGMIIFFFGGGRWSWPSWPAWPSSLLFSSQHPRRAVRRSLLAFLLF